jgi:hypothetical protein
MKNFSDFLNEAKLKGTKGVSDEYISDVERRAAPDIRDRVDPRQIMMLVGRATELTIGDVVNVHNYFQGRLSAQEKVRVRQRFSELEQLAEQVIRNNYGSILDNIDLDIKMVNPFEVVEFMEENSESKLKAKPKVQKEKEQDIESKAKDIDRKKDKEESDVDIEKVKSGIDKRKIANNIIQGEAKNTKNILHTEEVKEGLNRIFGERKAREIFSLWDQITKMANKLDWQIPIEVKAQMMEQNPAGMAGACACEWPGMPKAKDDQKQEILDSLETPDEDGSDEMSDEAEEALEDLFSQGNPKIKAVGIDFPMLLHETVKGIYEMIAAVAIPEDSTIASLIQMATSSYEDEAEDFRYGPYIAADLRDFVFKNPDSTKYPNVREFVFGELMSLEDDDFFDIISRILKSKVDGVDDSIARKKIDDIISDVIDRIKKWELGEVIGHEQEDEIELSDDDYYDLTSDSDIIPNEEGEKEFSKRELQEEIDAALDSGDMDRFRKLSQEYSKRFPE